MPGDERAADPLRGYSAGEFFIAVRAELVRALTGAAFMDETSSPDLGTQAIQTFVIKQAVEAAANATREQREPPSAKDAAIAVVEAYFAAKKKLSEGA